MVLVADAFEALVFGDDGVILVANLIEEVQVAHGGVGAGLLRVQMRLRGVVHGGGGGVEGRPTKRKRGSCVAGRGKGGSERRAYGAAVKKMRARCLRKVRTVRRL